MEKAEDSVMFAIFSVPASPLGKIFALMTASLLLAGCASAPLSAGTRAVVAVPKAEFFKYGPAQTFGPDFLLTKDTKVTVMSRDWAFTRVMTEDGTSGYIASEDLRAAPPEPPPSVAASTRRPTSARPRSSDVQSTPGSPLFDMSELPAMPTGEPPKPAPRFRF